MNTVSGCSEIVESTELNPRSKMNEFIEKHRMLKPSQVCSIEDDINKLFATMDRQLSNRVSKDGLSKRKMKRPMRSCSKIGFSDSMSLKQAFRGVSISQASQMAAVKRLSKQAYSARKSNSVSIGNKNLVDISLVPEQSTSKLPEKIKLFPNSDLRNRKASVLREKFEFSQSSKSSIGECSSSTSTSDESTLTGHRRHMSKDMRWEVIRNFSKKNGCLGLEHFKLIKKLGGGDIGSVYLAELMGTNCLFALKIMDTEFLISKKKVSRAETEKDILKMLDHPFVPSLYAYFTTERFSVLVMEYFPGGDLHALQEKQPNKRFSEQVSRFYIAEVLLALEYLHMLGIVYRDLKPENILLQEDGHIVLSDFDLSLRCSFSPTVLKMSPPKTETCDNSESKCFQSTSCFPRKLLSAKKSQNKKTDVAEKTEALPQLVDEPTNARSNSFVGTHEYLAPEIIRGEAHGSAVDWWALGIFIYELIYGKTPFKGPTNEDTLSNVVLQSIPFPDFPGIGTHTRDLIGGLLAKDPENRLGFSRGASEVKEHPFFEGLNWALIHGTLSPELPSGNVINNEMSVQKNKSMVEDLHFEMF